MKNLEKFFGTQKQWFCVVVIALLCAGTVFAQQTRQPAPAAPAAPTQPEAEAPVPKEKKNAITLDLMPLVKGILSSNSDADVLFVPLAFAYERQVAPHFSIVPNLDLYLGQVGEDADGDAIPYLYFSIVAEGRYYITEQMEKFFIAGLLGFNVQAIDGDADEEDGGFTGPLIGVKFGYKVLMGKTFFAEPSMSYIYSKSDAWALGWQGGLCLGVQF